MEGQWRSLGHGTRSMVILMVVLYIVKITLFDQTWIQYLVLDPSQVLKGQVWRLVTSALFHADLAHLFMNMMTLMQLGATFEAAVGTLSFWYHILVFGLLSNSFYVFLTWFMAISGDATALHSSAVGFSGVLFTLIVIDTSLTPSESRSVFGLFLVPSNIYPLALLVVSQLIIPHVSLIGHACGLIVGYLYKLGILKFLSPSTDFFVKLEKGMCLRCTRNRTYYEAQGQRPNQFRPYAVFTGGFGYDVESSSSSTGNDGDPFQGASHTLEPEPLRENNLENVENAHWDSL